MSSFIEPRYCPDLIIGMVFAGMRGPQPITPTKLAKASGYSTQPNGSVLTSAASGRGNKGSSDWARSFQAIEGSNAVRERVERRDGTKGGEPEGAKRVMVTTPT